MSGDSAADAATFRPDAVTFDNVGAISAAAAESLVAGGRLSVDMGASQTCNSAAVCLLINLLRTGGEQNCRVEFFNVSGQLKRLLNLYQLSGHVPHSGAD